MFLPYIVYKDTTDKPNLIDVVNEFSGLNESCKQNLGRFIESDFK